MGLAATEILGGLGTLGTLATAIFAYTAARDAKVSSQNALDLQKYHTNREIMEAAAAMWETRKGVDDFLFARYALLQHLGWTLKEFNNLKIYAGLICKNRMRDPESRLQLDLFNEQQLFSEWFVKMEEIAQKPNQ